MRGSGANPSRQPAHSIFNLPSERSLHPFRRAPFCLVLFLLACAHLVCAAEPPQSTVVGVVVLSKNATTAGAPLLSGQNVFAQNDLEVGDGATEITTADGTQLLLGPHTEVSMSRKGTGTTVVLDHGNLTFAQTSAGNGLSIRVGNVSVFAKASAKTQAVMTATSQSLLIATREGSVLVDREWAPSRCSNG
jgi:ferric-dicitrate binding protein FerR (iron transport regulator)